ncbi:hypothetical protein Pmani_004800 [Petrolisthes manimaculis]|uniref:Uncharacterized protein n=1 Tax=Petrolisthes manimaculis TaxID=1843537 RepID=A0AAE1UNM9_9EUCA|nr:hypothetical protein Pmani_004800 [Petrolisthes manimaculis]
MGEGEVQGTRGKTTGDLAHKIKHREGIVYNVCVKIPCWRRSGVKCAVVVVRCGGEASGRVAYLESGPAATRGLGSGVVELFGCVSSITWMFYQYVRVTELYWGHQL